MTGSLLRPLDALRAGSAWAQDWVFVLADKITPAGGWDDRTAAVYLVPKSPTLRAIAANLVAFTGDEVVVTPGESRVGVRASALRTTPIAAGMYGVEVKRLGGPAGPESLFIGEIPVRQSLSEIVEGEDCTDGLSLGGDTVGTVVVVPELNASYGTGVGPQGDSAYQVAIEDGFVGTPAEWLASLVGPSGPPVPLSDAAATAVAQEANAGVSTDAARADHVHSAALVLKYVDDPDYVLVPDDVAKLLVFRHDAHTFVMVPAFLSETDRFHVQMYFAGANGGSVHGDGAIVNTMGLLDQVPQGGRLLLLPIGTDEYGLLDGAKIAEVAGTTIDYQAETATRDGASVTVDSLVATSRASARNVLSGGVYVAKSAYIRRRTDDAWSGTPRGLLVGAPATNLLTQSRSLDHADWIKTGVTVSANTTDTLDPFGGNGADKITENTAAGTHKVGRSGMAIAPGGDVMGLYGFAVKRGAFPITGERYVQINFQPNTGGQMIAVVNTELGEITGTSGSPANRFTECLPIGNGWFFAYIHRQVVAAAATVILEARFCNGRLPTTTSYTGDGQAAFYIDAMYFSLGAVSNLADPILTTTAAASVNADLVGQDVVGYDPVSGTISVSADSGQLPAPCTVIHASDDTANNVIWLYRDTDMHQKLKVITGGVVQCNADLGTWAPGNAAQIRPEGTLGSRVAFSWRAGADLIIRRNYNKVVRVSGVTMPSGLTKLRAGADLTGVTGEVTLRSYRIYPEPLPDVRLRDLSTRSAVSHITGWGDSLTTTTMTGGPDAEYHLMPQIRREFTPARRAFDRGTGGQDSAQVAARRLADLDLTNTVSQYITGRNGVDGPAVVARTLDMIDWAEPSARDRFTVGNITPDASEVNGSAARATLDAANAYIQAAFPEDYFDITAELLQHGDHSDEDNADIAVGIPPRSLRTLSTGAVDSKHYGLAGVTVWAKNACAPTIVAREAASWFRSDRALNPVELPSVGNHAVGQVVSAAKGQANSWPRPYAREQRFYLDGVEVPAGYVLQAGDIGKALTTTTRWRRRPTATPSAVDQLTSTSAAVLVA
jgi:hypothetical protein